MTMTSTGYRNAVTGRVPKFKVILVGELGVGKSSLFVRLKDNIFGADLEPTLGIESCSKCVMVNELKVMLQIWDTAGLEKYHTLTGNYYRNAQAVVLVYSVDNPASLHYLSKWVADAKHFSPTALLFLLGNKTDVGRSIPVDSIHDFSSAHDCKASLFASAKTGEGLHEAMCHIARAVLQTNAIPEISDHFSLEFNKYPAESSCIC